jgi:hypothetical protein
MGWRPQYNEVEPVMLVDSSAWIDYFNDLSTWLRDSLDNYLSNVPVVMGDLILTEILEGFRSNNDVETAKKLLSPFLIPPNRWIQNRYTKCPKLTFPPKSGCTCEKWEKARSMGRTIRLALNIPSHRHGAGFRPRRTTCCRCCGDDAQ